MVPWNRTESPGKPMCTQLTNFQPGHQEYSVGKDTLFNRFLGELGSHLRKDAPDPPLQHSQNQFRMELKLKKSSEKIREKTP